MDENTKYIVASNLTLAYYNSLPRKSSEPEDVDRQYYLNVMLSGVMEIFQSYLSMLDSLEDSERESGL